MNDAKYRILAIEPNTADMQLLCRALEKSGIVKDLSEATTLSSAMTIIADQRPEVIIANLMLPPDQIKEYLSRLDNCENKNRHLQDLMIDLIHKMAQPLQVLGNTLEITTTETEDESLKLCRRMVGQISDLLKGFRQNCRNS